MFKLYELVNKKENPISFSSYVISVKLFLKHKGLEFESIPLTYTEVKPTISKLTNGNWNKVPLLIAPNSDIIYNSLDIGKYLEANYPSPTLNINNLELEQLMLDYEKTSDISYSLNIMDLYNCIDDKDKPYFIPSRENLLGISIEEYIKDPDYKLELYYQKTLNIGEILKNSAFLNGNEPGFYDYLLAGKIQYNRLISPSSYKKLTIDHPKKSIFIWFTKMMELFDGYLKNANSVENTKLN